ncbi:MAG: phosphate ABC transporter substrate-binding/OmpA family protein [Pararhodobacter sp.]
MYALSRVAVLAAALFLLPPEPSSAQDVTLHSADGRMTVSGTLLAYDGEYLRLDTEFGALTLDARGLRCEGPGCPLLEEAVLEAVIEGAPVIAEALLPSVLDAFAAAQGLTVSRLDAGAEQVFELADPTGGAPVMRLRLRASSSDAGLLALAVGEVDLALTLTPLDGEDFVLHVLALDAFVPVVATNSMLQQVAMADLLAILHDDIGGLDGPGGAAMPLSLHMRGHDAGEHYALGARLLALGLEGIAEQAVFHASSGSLLAAVARDPLALGMTLRSQARHLATLPLVDGCGIVLDAGPVALKTGEYPLAQPLYAVQRRHRLPLRLRQLLAFFHEPEAISAMRAAGFAETRFEPLPLEMRAQRLVNTLIVSDPAPQEDAQFLAALRDLADWLRHSQPLTLAFRFEPGAARIDATSQALVGPLARAIEAGVFAGHEVVLAGFTDSEGGYEANRRLALRRAEALHDELAAASALRDAGQILRAEGFGPLLPIACNDSEWGRALNRRVEVWLRPHRD